MSSPVVVRRQYRGLESIHLLLFHSMFAALGLSIERRFCQVHNSLAGLATLNPLTTCSTLGKNPPLIYSMQRETQLQIR